MSGSNSDDGFGEHGRDMSPSPEIPLLYPTKSRLGTSKKKLDFEEAVSQVLADSADNDKHHSSRSKTTVMANRGKSKRDSKPATTTSSKLNALARGVTNTKGASKSPRQHKEANSSSKTSPLTSRGYPVTTPHNRPLPLKSTSNPEGSRSKAISRLPSKSSYSSSMSVDSRKLTIENDTCQLSQDNYSSDDEPSPKRSSTLSEILREVQKANTRLDSYEERLKRRSLCQVL